jgi:hypothetical protein
LKSESLNLLEPSGSPRPVVGLLLFIVQRKTDHARPEDRWAVQIWGDEIRCT